jgi:hypothetical protein
MNLEQLIRALQSRIAKRANTIRDLEIMRTHYKEMGIGQLVWGASLEIKPLAIEQKQDRDILDILCSQRTLNDFIGKLNGGFYLETEEGALRI